MSSPPDLELATFRAVAEHVCDAVEIADGDGRLLYVNPAWQRLTAWPAAEAIGCTPRILRSHYHDDAFYAGMQATADREGVWTGEVISRRKDGTLFFAHVTLQSFGGGRRYVVVRRDLTGELRGIREHAERYAMALLATRDGLSDWDILTGEVVSSDRWKELLQVEGGPRDLPYRFVERLHPDDAAEFGRLLDVHLGSGSAFFECAFRVVHPDGEVLHVELRAFTLRDADASPVRMVAVLSDVTEQRRAQALLFHTATHDALTGLPTRALFVEHLGAAIGRASRHEGISFALLYIDLRHFKSINDACGHAAGDAVLRAVGQRLRECIRPGDSVARLGGDEFAMLLEGVRSPAVADTAARRVLRAIERPVEIDGQVLEVSATIGVSLGDAHSEVEPLVRAADSAMYEARELDSQAVRVATPDGSERTVRRARMANALREALARRRIQVAYQPIVRLADGVIVGVEVLARWSTPEFPDVSPAEFVPLAEDMRLAGRLGQVVLEFGLEQLRAWEKASLLDPSFRLHVNISPKQLIDPRLPTQLGRMREAGLLGASRLCFEITETALVNRPELVSRTIEAVRALGVTFALDDFGTGFSSLAHLRGFSVSGVKIDRSFIARLPADTVSKEIVVGLMTMTRALGLDVVAEGVETAEQAALLAGIGCPCAQGYHYARPMPAAAMTELLSLRRSRA